MANPPFRILQVGLGNRGRMWIKVIDRRPDTVHSGVVAINPTTLAAFAHNHSEVPTFTRLEEALTQTESDAAPLVTPPDSHLMQARQIFAAGLPLLKVA